jgi:hypothetical protein
MHGSINWANEPHAFKIHDSVHAAFRTDKRLGELAIVPPLPEKEMPPWLYNVWKEAEGSLIKSNTWFICGYSLPTYDLALEEFFQRAAHQVNGLTIYISDPKSKELKERWKNISPVGTQVIPLCEPPTLFNCGCWDKLSSCKISE